MSLPVRVLHRRIHLVEQRQIVQPSLRIQQCALIQRIARMNLYTLLHHGWLGVHDARHQHLIDKYLFALGHIQGDVGLMRIAAFDILLYLNPRVRESVAQVIPQNRIAISRQRDQRIRLACLRVQQTLHILLSAARPPRSPSRHRTSAAAPL